MEKSFPNIRRHMENAHEEKFVTGVEKLIIPSEVSNLLFFQRLKGLLPPRLLKHLLYRASKNTPYIGFVIEPYSFFLFFKLRDIEMARAMLPDRYELAKTRIFDDDEPEYYMGIGNLNTRASTFWGMRQESYLIATDKETGLLSFIFIEILSNTLIAMPTKGIVDPNCRKALFTNTARGEVFVDFEDKRSGRQFALTGNIKRGKTRKLYEPLWLMGNTSIAHSKDLASGDYEPFSVIFDPAEVYEALDIPPEDVQISENSLFPGLAEAEPCKVVCFPFAQHYIADSPGCRTTVKDKEDLIDHYNKIASSGINRTFSAKTIVRQVSAIIGLLVLLATLLLLLL